MISQSLERRLSGPTQQSLMHTLTLQLFLWADPIKGSHSKDQLSHEFVLYGIHKVKHGPIGRFHYHQLM